jgi:hypothetical protein
MKQIIDIIDELHKVHNIIKEKDNAILNYENMFKTMYDMLRDELLTSSENYANLKIKYINNIEQHIKNMTSTVNNRPVINRTTEINPQFISNGTKILSNTVNAPIEFDMYASPKAAIKALKAHTKSKLPNKHGIKNYGTVAKHKQFDTVYQVTYKTISYYINFISTQITDMDSVIVGHVIDGIIKINDDIIELESIESTFDQMLYNKINNNYVYIKI